VDPIQEELAELSAGCGVVELPVSVIRLAGEDRVRFLHNFCTADIKKMEDERSCEAFFLNTKGKTISHGVVVKRPIDLLIVSTAASPTDLMENLDRFLLSEDVQIEDVSELWRCIFVTGSNLEAVIGKCDFSMPAADQVLLDGFRVLFAAEMGGEGICILEPSAGDVESGTAIVAAGGKLCSAAAFETHRIRSGTPWVGHEITEANLPQEFNRDAKAISFTKGCYLGQETVARLDAMGHVNQRLAKFTWVSGEPMAVGDVIGKNSKRAASLTSVTTVGGSQIGLGMVRVAAVGTETNGELEAENCVLGFTVC